MKALFLDGIGKLAVRDTPKPVPKPDEILVRVEACGICGTDRHLFLGEFPSSPPVTLGHEFSGMIEAVGQDVADLAVGMRVTGDPNICCGACPACHAGRVNLCHNLQAIGIHRHGGFAEYVVMPRKQAFVLPLALDPLHGAFCEPLACCLHGVDLAQIKAGASVAIVGGGVIGLLTVQLARLAGATRVALITRNPGKRALAARLGATACFDPSAPELDSYIRKTGGADVVFECAGLADTVAGAPRLARRGGMVVILGVLPAGQKVEIEPFDLLFREVSLITSFINPFTQARAADLIATGAVQVAPLITRTITLEQAVEVIGRPAPNGEIRALVLPAGR